MNMSHMDGSYKKRRTLYAGKPWALLDPAVQGGNPAATGLITTQFCTGQILINGAAPVSGTAIGARAYCSPVKL